MSVAELLGGYRARVPVYASTTPGQKTPGGLDSVERYAEFVQSCMERGIPAFKIHSFFDGNARTEIDIVSAVRSRVGDAMQLMTDPASSLPSFMDGPGCWPRSLRASGVWRSTPTWSSRRWWVTARAPTSNADTACRPVPFA